MILESSRREVVNRIIYRDSVRREVETLYKQYRRPLRNIEDPSHLLVSKRRGHALLNFADVYSAQVLDQNNYWIVLDHFASDLLPNVHWEPGLDVNEGRTASGAQSMILDEPGTGRNLQKLGDVR